jgi:NADH-quinone oxidoreductase subunit L
LLGIVTWWQHHRLAEWATRLCWLRRAARNEFGFIALNHYVAQSTQQAAMLLQKTQTGQLNWNMFGIIAGLVLLLAILLWSV